MKTNFENIKTKLNEFFKSDKARIGGACACALVLCVGVGFGVSAMNSQNSHNLTSKALENTVSENTKTEGENTEKSTENGENTENNEVTVNENGEVVDNEGHVVAESVEQYNATPNSQSRPVNTSNTSSVTPQASNNTVSNSGERVEGNLNYGHWERQPYEVKVEDGYYKYIDGRRCNECGTYLYNGQQSVNEHFAATGHGSHSSFQIPTNEWVDTSYTYIDYKNVWVWDR